MRTLDAPDRAGPPPPLRHLLLPALAAFAAVAGTFQIKAYDLFWHLATGRHILATGALPERDPLRFTSGGAPWVDHEWLFQVVAAGLEGLGGLTLLTLLRTGLVVGLALLLLHQARRSGAPLPWAVIAVVVTVLGVRPRLFLRPEMVTLFALVLLLAALQELRRRHLREPLGGWSPWLTSALPLALFTALGLFTALWANAHPGALAAPVVAGAFLVGTRLPGGMPATARPLPWSWVLGLPALLAAALLATPHGVEIFTIPGRIGSALEALPGVNPEWLPLWRVPGASVYFLLVVAALVGLAAWTAWRRRAALDPATGLAALALAVLAVESLRHQALFYGGAFFFAGECLGRLAGGWDDDSGAPRPEPILERPGRRGRATAVALAVCLLAAAWCLWPPSRGPLEPRQGVYRFGLGVEPGRFPEHLADEVEERWSDLGPLYNNVAWGGYLLWRFHPPRQVFNDGRNEVDPDFLRELAEARRGGAAWQGLLDRYAIDGAVVRYEDRLRPVLAGPPAPGAAPEAPAGRTEMRTSNALFFPREEFALVAWDDTGMLLVRRSPERAERIARQEYRHLHPEDWRASFDRALAAAASGDPEPLRGLAEELDRRLAEEPRSRRAETLARELQRRLAGATGSGP